MVYEVISRAPGGTMTAPERHDCDSMRIEPSGALSLFRGGVCVNCWAAGIWVYVWLVTVGSNQSGLQMR